MKIEALNCPNCGASVADESPVCGHCKSRLKTVSCTGCFETVFEGSRFCPFCGARTSSHSVSERPPAGDCPRCASRLETVTVLATSLDECTKCSGVWCDIDTFEAICSDKESQSAVLKQLEGMPAAENPSEIRYVPCPVCRELMNRNNFARISGVIIDTCRAHGVWFDARELPRIIDFIRQGGLDAARRKEKLAIADERNRLKHERFRKAVEQHRSDERSTLGRSGSVSAIREFIDFLLN